MKKKLCVFLSLILAAAVFFPACQYSNNKLSVPDSDYVVTSNGGLAVQQGNYVYFVNGYADPVDEDGKNNVWGDVEKGGIYRAELCAAPNAKSDYTYLDRNKISSSPIKPVDEKNQGLGIKSFNYRVNQTTDLAFESETKIDSEETSIDFIKVERLVPKIINNANDRGLYIFDGYIYYTTPNNRKDTSNTLQYTYSDFMRTSLDGKKTQRIATSTTATPQFNYYYLNGKTYLVIYENETLLSYEMDGKKIKGYTIAEKVGSVLFADQDVWYKGKVGKNIEDFVFYTRSPGESDIKKSGNIIVMMSPDGKQSKDVAQPGTVTFHSIVDGLLFYTVPNGSFTELRYTDCAQALKEINGKNPYEVAPGASIVDIDGVAMGDVSTFTSYVCRRTSVYSDVIFVWGFGANGINYYENGSKIKQTTDQSFSLEYFDRANNYFYYFGDGGEYQTLYFVRSDLDLSQQAEPLAVLETGAKSSFYGIDIAAGHFWFVSETITEWQNDYIANDYLKIMRINHGSIMKEKFIGFLIEDDLIEDEDEE